MLINIDDDKLGRVRLKCDRCSGTVEINKSSYSHWRKRNGAANGDYICSNCKIISSNEARTVLPDKMVSICTGCGEPKQSSKRSRRTKLCVKCAAKLASAEAAKNPRSGFVMTDEAKRKISETNSYKWSNDTKYRQKQLSYRNTDWKLKISNSVRKAWSDNKYATCLTRRNTWLQRAAEAILQMLNINYQTEATVSEIIPYAFDIKVGTCLIELDGDYWHSLPNVVANDKRKNNYIDNKNASGSNYRLFRISEHNILCFNMLYDFIVKSLDIKTIEQTIIKFTDLQLIKTDIDSVRDFVNAFHYLGKPRRGGIAYKVMYNNTIAAVTIVQRPVRQEVATSMGIEYNQCYELTRIIVNPKYHKSNIISWMLSRVIKDLRKFTNTKLIVSFADTTYGHTGACYKASNFILHSIVPPDYQYTNSDGYIMHKKTLWDHAMKMSMTENEFARKFGYIKTLGKEKLKYVYRV